MGTTEEIRAMQAVAKAVEDLDDEVKSRVLRWAAEAFKVPFAPVRGVVHGGVGNGGAARRANPPAGDEGAGNGFNKVSDFFAAAAPATTQDRVLVAAYWFQVMKNEDEFTGFAVNTELKHLGHKVENITKALSSLMSRIPALVMQTKKTGTAMQARKQYKLTQPGIERVQDLLAGGASGNEEKPT